MSSDSTPINIIVLADDPLVRAGLASSLSQDEEFRVVAQLQISDLEAEEELLIDADVLLIDVGWSTDQREDGNLIPDDEVPVLRLVDPSLLETSVRISSLSMISRESGTEAIKAALHAVLSGWVVLDPLLMTNQVSTARHDLDELLTDRELEVLLNVAEGLTNRAISKELSISDNTVKYHLNAIMSKLGAQSRTEAVVIAARAGLIPL
jgi:DNA-binding NarL/FixJ family response regulator